MFSALFSEKRGLFGATPALPLRSDISCDGVFPHWTVVGDSFGSKPLADLPPPAGHVRVVASPQDWGCMCAETGSPTSPICPQ